MFRLAMIAVFSGAKLFVRGGYNPSLHFMAVHSGVFRRPATARHGRVFRYTTQMLYLSRSGATADRVWHIRGSLATGGLERHGKDWKLEFLAGTARLQQNAHNCNGYTQCMRRRNMDWGITFHDN